MKSCVLIVGIILCCYGSGSFGVTNGPLTGGSSTPTPSQGSSPTTVTPLTSTPKPTTTTTPKPITLAPAQIATTPTPTTTTTPKPTTTTTPTPTTLTPKPTTTTAPTPITPKPIPTTTTSPITAKPSMSNSTTATPKATTTTPKPTTMLTTNTPPTTTKSPTMTKPPSSPVTSTTSTPTPRPPKTTSSTPATSSTTSNISRTSSTPATPSTTSSTTLAPNGTTAGTALPTPATLAPTSNAAATDAPSSFVQSMSTTEVITTTTDITTDSATTLITNSTSAVTTTTDATTVSSESSSVSTTDTTTTDITTDSATTLITNSTSAVTTTTDATTVSSESSSVSTTDVKYTSTKVAPVDPCTSYKPLPKAEYRGGNCHYNISNEVCDQSLDPLGSWYVVQGPVGYLVMQESPADFGTCGTNFPIWMNDTHPSISEGVVDRQVCQADLTDSCSKASTIKVKNCSRFYVYQLPATGSCPEGYCFGGTDMICSPFDCGTLSLSNGNVSYQNGTTYPSTADISCNAGYDLDRSSSSQVTCLSSGNWTTPLPNCLPKDCGKLSHIPNGNVNYRNGTTYQSTADISCDAGYDLDLSGSSQVSCLSSGKWTTPLPSCVPKDCGNVSFIPNGNISYTNGTTFPSTADISCDVGYDLDPSNSSEVACLPSGNWSTPLSSCVPKNCGNVSHISHGNVSYPNGTTYLSTADISCDSGYDLDPSNSSEVVCLPSGSWSTPLPSCVPKDCGNVSQIPHGNVSYPNGTTYPSKVNISCDAGYDLDTLSSPHVTCLQSGSWSTPLPTCVPKDCGNVSFIPNGNISYQNGTTYLSAADISCDIGYDLDHSNSSQVTCTTSGSWSSPLPTCVPKDCGNVSHINHGKVNYRNGTTYPSTADIACDSGYDFDPSSSSQVTCLPSGNWTAPLPICIPKDCGNVSDIPHGNVSYRNGTTYHSTADISCDVGYDIYPSISSQVACLPSGNWTTPLPTCVQKDCGNISHITHGNVSYRNGTTYQSSADIRCDDGYDLVPSNSSQLTCLSSGSWTTPLPSCVPKECGSALSVDNANISYPEGTTYQSKALVTCNVGFEHPSGNKSSTVTCLSEAWATPLPTCAPIECGRPASPANGAVDYTNTTYNSNATYSCHLGYDIKGNADPVHCMDTGKWSYASVSCKIRDCRKPRNITHGVVSYTNTTFGAQAFYSCDKKYILTGRSVIRCRSEGAWTNSTVKCVIDKNHIRCTKSVDDRGTTWNETKPGEVVVINCAGHLESQKVLTGDITRQCGEDGIWKLPKYDCVSQEFLKIETQVDELKTNKDPEQVDAALYSLSEATSDSGISDHPLFGGELKKATTLLETIADVSSDITVSKKQSQNFIDTASNLLDPKNQQSWEAVSDTDDDEEKKSAGAGKVLEVIDKYANAIANTLKGNNETKRVVENKNMALQVAKIDTAQDIQFPDKQLKKISTKSTIALKQEDLKGVTSYSAVVYKNLSGILPSESNNNSKTTQSINSVVLSLDLHGGTTTLKSNVTINLEHAKKGLVQPVCSFWNTKLVAWDSRGCSLVSTTGSLSVCQCSHLTNFAILMSPWTDNIVTKALDVISTVGCSVSLAALIITVAMHVALWRYMKSDRTVILMNLSVALVVSYVVFIAGVDRTENEDVCTSVAVVLQYIYLVVFFLMLVEGIDLAITVLYVFHTKSRTKWMLPLAWGVPVVIVGISLGATQLKGYGTDDFCWLSIEDGLIWGFVGPALCIILVNIVLLILILRAMFSAKSLSARSKVAKVKTGVKSLCVLLPLIGSTWVLGMLYVNKDFAWVQYVFSVCNSLQGLVIFIFHCAFNPQMRVALQKQRKKYFDSQSLKSASTKQFSMPRVSTSSFSHSESDDRPYSRSISQDSYADYHQPDYHMSGLHSFSSSRSSNHYTDFRF